MTKIILVRHGHVEGISPERFRGRADLALTPQGLRQAEATARRIEASWTPAALYASPLSRCRATAEAIGRPFDLTPTRFRVWRISITASGKG
jgi:probable phosphoglycerate mutase